MVVGLGLVALVGMVMRPVFAGMVMGVGGVAVRMVVGMLVLVDVAVGVDVLVGVAVPSLAGVLVFVLVDVAVLVGVFVAVFVVTLHGNLLFEQGYMHSRACVYRILLVEDEQVNRLAVRRMLEKAGHAVVLAGNGQEALEHLAGGNFDCVLMDIQMPVMDGLTATRAIRDSETRQTLPRIPIIAMTAYAMAGDRERCLAAGMDDYLAKPVGKAALRDVIGRAMAGAGPAIFSFALFYVASFYISC